MSQENVQTDTPQNDTQEYQSLEEAVFGSDIEGSNSSVESAFNTGTEDTGEVVAPQEGQVVPQGGQPITETTQTTDNDTTRYQYWQSTADKLKSENASLRNSMAQQSKEIVDNQNTPPVQESAEEAFPPAPDKPGKPRTFNREEAYADPASESAKYLDEVDDWRDNIAEYNTLKTQYDQAVMHDKFDKMETQKREEAMRFEASQKKAGQANEIKKHVMGAYSMNNNEADDFMQRMSDPKSLNIDNLVQLYRIQQGGGNQPNAAPSPSPEFRQTQNAQQVPSPMGVMPSGQSNVDGRSFEDKVMDNLIGDFNSKNPWK